MTICSPLPPILALPLVRKLLNQAATAASGSRTLYEEEAGLLSILDKVLMKDIGLGLQKSRTDS